MYITGVSPDIEIEAFSRAELVILHASLSGRDGTDVVWQHVQLFRSHKDEDKDKGAQLKILIKLQRK